MVSMDCILALLVGVVCGILLTSLPQIAYHQKNEATDVVGGSSNQSYDPILIEEEGQMAPVEQIDDTTGIDSLLTTINTINLVLDDDEIELAGLVVDGFEIDDTSDISGVANINLRLSSEELLNTLLQRQVDDSDSDEEEDTFELAAVYYDEGDRMPKSRSPVTSRQYVQHPAQNAAKKAMRKDRSGGSDGSVNSVKKTWLRDRRLLEEERDFLLQQKALLEEERDLWGKKTFKKIGKAAKKTTKKVGKVAKKTTKKATKHVKKTTKKATKHVKKTTKTVGKVATKTTKQAGKAVSSAGKAIAGFAGDAWDQVKKLKKEIEKLKKEIEDLKEDLDKWKNKAGKALSTIAKLPDLIVDKVVDPVVDDLEDAFDDLDKIEDLAKKVAKGAVSVIKKIDLLPLGKKLAKQLADGMLDFLGLKNGGLCVPYKCIIEKLGGIDISDIELYSSDNVRISTAIKPETCLSITEIAFDVGLLDDFMDVFRKLIDLKEIYEKVEKFIKKEMKKIIAWTDEIGELLDDVEDIVEDAAKTLGLKRRRILTIHSNTTQGISKEPVTMEELSAIAYEKGLAHFKKLYGQEVKRVYEERDLKKKGKSFIGFKKFKLKISQNFGQTLTMEASYRTGYADSLFDEAMHQEQRIPIPYTANMVNVLVSGSVEGSLPYAVSLDASATATFGYDMGAFGLEVDMVRQKIGYFKNDFKPIVDISAKVGISGSTSLNFAASASLGICVGPDDDACIIVTLDAHQKAAAGFDALAGLNLESTALTAMYAEDIEYKNDKLCDKQLALSAGYWAYVKEPHITLSITGKTPCDEKSATLFEVGGGYLFKHSDQFCIDTDII